MSQFDPISIWSKTNTIENYSTNTYKQFTLFRTKMMCLNFLDQNGIGPKLDFPKKEKKK
jgi:hypothetical protein